MAICTLCKENMLSTLLELGPQPISHRFVKDLNEQELLHPLTIGQCANCALMQVIKPFPFKDVQPIYEWLECTEPEAHLDKFVEDVLSKLSNLDSNSLICGVSFKEESTLERMSKHGFKKTWSINPQKDLEDENPLSNIETLQNKLTRESAKDVVSMYGKSDLAIARHIIEHAYDLKEFVLAIKSLVKVGGYVYLEIPDCINAMNSLDYTTIWEEHISYFTPNTFKTLLAHCGLELEYFETIPYPLEDSHIAVAKVLETDSIQEGINLDGIETELKLGEKFSTRFYERKKALNDYLETHKSKIGPIAVFGAAHMSSIFINLFDISEHIDFVVDDNTNKQDYLMPGSKLPILSSSELISRGIKLCLLSLAPASEEKVLAKNESYLTSGGKFLSIFPANPNSIPYGDL